MPNRNKVTFRGVSMVEGWPEKIEEAQRISSCEIKGKSVSRVRYGDEEGDWGSDNGPCHDCGVIKGEIHVEGCDVERCAGCDAQRFGCDCEPYDDSDDV